MDGIRGGKGFSPRLLVVSCALLGLCSCAVVHPPGWEARAVPPTVIGATPGVMYGFAPMSWDLPDGRRIEIDVAECKVTSGIGSYSADIAFSAAFTDDSGDRIRCETAPVGPGVPRTRFGCWNEGDSTEALTFWLAPDEDCPARNAAVATTLTNQRCWNGELSHGGETYSLVHGYLAKTESPVGFVSWVAGEEPLLVADIVVDSRVVVHEVDAALPDELRRRLVLLTVALSWWEHASRPD
jgi:hypothetical protein